MAGLVALLRGINVGGHNKLPMQDLRTLMAQCGATGPQTVIQSGNAVFSLDKDSPEKFADDLAAAIDARFGFSPRVMLMPVTELTRCLDNAPFHPEEPKHLHVWFLDEQPQKPDLARLSELKAPNESFSLEGKWFYLHAPDGIGRSKLAERVEKALGVSGTARNLNTLQKLEALAKP